MVAGLEPRLAAGGGLGAMVLRRPRRGSGPDGMAQGVGASRVKARVAAGAWG